jgi:hypothetical protein
MVMSIPDPGDFTETNMVCQQLIPYCIFDKEVLIRRLLKKFVQQGRSE